ncbi:MAG TPA: 50S ribosomal protein L11 methyltransferase [Usitatibacter sp.]|nr:50S ribosomal protein L11 methyltransferase [Usitatibacter sp.]
MAWRRLALVVEGRHAEALAEALEKEGALATEITDADEGTEREQAIFGEPGSEAKPWARARVSALLALEVDSEAVLERALRATAAPPLEPAQIDRIEDADWVALTQRQFEPIRVGERLWIVPTWYLPPEPQAVNVILDPGAAFGTGSHPTTRLCLAWLERNLRPGQTVLDYGCGSGILGIAALKLGAAAATGVDVDPLAVEAARYNSRLNDVMLDVRDAHASPPPAADITVANILANPLRMLAPLIATQTRPGGTIALSGILESQAAGVIEAYAPHARLAVVASDSGWVLLAGPREGPAC